MAKTKPAPATPVRSKAAKSVPAKTPTKSRTQSAKSAEASPVAAPGGKLGILVTMLSRKDGATIADLVAATGWQAHSVRGAMSGALGKKRGLTIMRARADGVSTYRIPA